MIAGLDAYSESDVVTADGGDKADTATDNGSGKDAGSQVTDASVILVDDSAVMVVAADAEIVRDTGAASDAACTLIKNGAATSCGQDASNCCSGVCDETSKCTGNSCATIEMACRNGLSFVTDFKPYFRAQGNCCVNAFCNPNANTATDGKCAACVKPGLTPPLRTAQYFSVIQLKNVDAPVVYDDACCSHQLDGNGNCK